MRLRLVPLCGCFFVAVTAYKRIEIPRISVWDIQSDENTPYREGALPFVLTNATMGWRAMTEVSPHWLVENFADSIVDLYKDSMEHANVKPHLDFMDDALPHLLAAEDDEHSAYVQWRMTAEANDHFHQMVQPFPAWAGSDWWEDCWETAKARENFRSTTSWRMMCIGNTGAGMFQHFDSFHTAVWQAQIVGSKRWTLCDPKDSKFLYKPGQVDSFNPDYKKFPLLKKAHCAEFEVREGEVLFYPSNWWHQTINVGWPTIGYVGRMVTRYNFNDVAASLVANCRDNSPDPSLSYKGASTKLNADACSRIQSCKRAWQEMWGQQAQLEY